MIDQVPETSPETGTRNVFRNVLLAVAAIYVIASLVLLVDMRSRIEKLETVSVTQQQMLTELGTSSSTLKSNLKASIEALAGKLGMTQKELAARTAELQRQRHADDAAADDDYVPALHPFIVATWQE